MDGWPATDRKDGWTDERTDSWTSLRSFLDQGSMQRGEGCRYLIWDETGNNLRSMHLIRIHARPAVPGSGILGS